MRPATQPDWQGVPEEAWALFHSIIGRIAAQPADNYTLARSLCLMQHAYHRQLPCMVCRAWLPVGAIERLEDAAMYRNLGKPPQTVGFGLTEE